MTPLRVMTIRVPAPPRTAADGPLPQPEYYRASDWFSQVATDTYYDIVCIESYEVPSPRRWQPQSPLPAYTPPEECRNDF